MKTLPEFLSLSIEDQFEHIWNTCTHLASRQEKELTIHLYYGKGLLVEVWVNAYADVVGIRPFTQYRHSKAILESNLVEERLWK